MPNSSAISKESTMMNISSYCNWMPGWSIRHLYRT